MSAKDYKEALQQKEEEVKQFREVNKKIEVMVFKDGSSRLNFLKEVETLIVLTHVGRDHKMYLVQK